MSSDNESEISTLTPSQDNDTKKEDDSADEPVEEHAENLPNDNADRLVDARSSPSPTLPENEFDYEEEDAINLDNNDVNYEEEDQQIHKIETHMPEAEELQGEDISEGESDEEDEKVDEGKNCKEESKIKQEEESAEEGELDNLEEGEIIDSDDGIPEIKESMTPPTDDFSKSFETHNNYANDNNIGDYQQQPYEHRERETCRFFLRGNCKNGSICRFKHSFTTNDRVQYQQSASNTIRPPRYIPPPTGPPVPLLTTEFAPPPSLAPLIRPSAPVNTDSVAWEQGLKKAREIVRRQKTETTPTKGADEKEEEEAADNKSDDSFGNKFEENDEKSPPRFATAETVKPKVEEAPRQFQQHRHFPPSSNTQNHHHRPIASRMVVEYVSKVTSPSIGGGSYGQRKGNEKYKSKATIPSLIDNIIDKPMSPPPRGRTSMKGKQQRDQDGRRTFKTNNYADPWSRQNSSGGGDHDGGAKRDGRRNQQLSRKRRHSSSITSSSSDEGTTNRRVRRSSPSTNLHRKSNNRHSNESLAKERTSMEREDARKVAKREESSSMSKVNLRRNDSASSHTSSSKKGEKKPMTHGRQPSSRSSSVSSTTSTSSDSSSREAVTLGSLLKTNPLDMAHQSAKSKGPKTPPTPAEQPRPSSESTSVSSRPPSAENKKKRGLPSNHTDKSENTRSRQNSIKLDQQRRFSRSSNQSIENDGKRRHSQLSHSSFLKNEENEEEDAPAAYRISRKSSEDVKQKRRNDRASSSSSLSSSSSSSSSLTSSSSTIGHGQRKNKSAGEEKAMVTICSSERNIPIAEPSLDDKVAPISSDDEADVGKANGQKLRELAKQGGMDGIEEAVTLHQKAKDKVGADKVNTKEGHKSVADVENSSSSSNVQNNKEESRKRKLEILQKLQSVEKAIARKKQKNKWWRGRVMPKCEDVL